MASGKDIRKEIKFVVDQFGWEANLLNGFWVKLDDIQPSRLLKFSRYQPIYCNAVTLPNLSIDYQNVSISVNKFQTPVPMAKTKGDLILEITGGSSDYIKNIRTLFEFGNDGKSDLDVATLFSITVYTYKANYDRVRSIQYKNCYLKDIGSISYEQSATNTFFKCPYTFTVGYIKSPLD